MSHGKLLLAIHKQSLAIFPKMQQDKIWFYALLVVHDHYSAESVEQDQTANDWSKVKVSDCQHIDMETKPCPDNWVVLRRFQQYFNYITATGHIIHSFFGVSQVLGWDSEVSYPRAITHKKKNQRIQCKALDYESNTLPLSHAGQWEKNRPVSTCLVRAG